jgi:hypothetical protein
MKDTVGETKDSTIFFPEKGSFEAEKDMAVKTTNARVEFCGMILYNNQGGLLVVPEVSIARPFHASI